MPDGRRTRMLYKFLAANRGKILASVDEKTVGISEDRPTSKRSALGLPQFYDHLVSELERKSKVRPKHPEGKRGRYSTAVHGKELSRLGYTVSQVVHGYGALCQAITELATTSKTVISAIDFQTLNFTLDVAIAEAVTGFTDQSGRENVDSTERMGVLVHELRNSLAAALIAQSLIKKGVVGTGGSTNAVLERNLNRMREILDRSFSEVRMRNEKTADLRPVRLVEIVEEVEATASEEARRKGLTLKVEVDSLAAVNTDRHYLISALANLVQNAIKYTKPGGTIWLRAREEGGSVRIEVEDRCGGLPKGKAEELFRPFVQKSSNRTGLGLGLTISRHAVALGGGTLAVRDLPGKGCVFTITLPRLARAGSRPPAKVSR
jgi:signal transduction histidine kinase